MSLTCVEFKSDAFETKKYLSLKRGYSVRNNLNEVLELDCVVGVKKCKRSYNIQGMDLCHVEKWMEIELENGEYATAEDWIVQTTFGDWHVISGVSMQAIIDEAIADGVIVTVNGEEDV